MGNSLRDQLLKAGLVNTKQVKQSQHQQRKAKGPKVDPAQQAAAQQAQAAKAERDRDLNRKRQEEAERKALAAQIKQIVEANRIDKGEGDIPYNFVDGSKVKRIYVTKPLHEQLVRGALCIVKQGGRYELLPLEAAEKVRERDAARVIAAQAEAPTAPEENDPYAAFQVPDDLIW